MQSFDLHKVEGLRRGEVLEQKGRLLSIRRGIRNDNACSQEV